MSSKGHAPMQKSLSNVPSKQSMTNRNVGTKVSLRNRDFMTL